MYKKELVNEIAAKQGVTKKKADKILRDVLECIMLATIDTGECCVNGFGSFKLKNVPEHSGTNPQTGEKITIPERQRISFKPGSVFKGSL